MSHRYMYNRSHKSNDKMRKNVSDVNKKGRRNEYKYMFFSFLDNICSLTLHGIEKQFE